VTDPSARRAEIWLVDFGTPIGHEQGFRRPAVVVSADRMNMSRAGLVIMVPVTRTHRGLPSHVELDADDAGLQDTSYAKAEEVKSVSVERLVRRLGQVPAPQMQRLSSVLRLLLDI
jgi:mRNA interferase MazF